MRGQALHSIGIQSSGPARAGRIPQCHSWENRRAVFRPLPFQSVDGSPYLSRAQPATHDVARITAQKQLSSITIEAAKIRKASDWIVATNIVQEGRPAANHPPAGKDHVGVDRVHEEFARRRQQVAGRLTHQATGQVYRRLPPPRRSPARKLAVGPDLVQTRGCSFVQGLVGGALTRCGGRGVPARGGRRRHREHLAGVLHLDDHVLCTRPALLVARPIIRAMIWMMPAAGQRVPSVNSPMLWESRPAAAQYSHRLRRSHRSAGRSACRACRPVAAGSV